jgi:filamentous hemagglutinin family protein
MWSCAATALAVVAGTSAQQVRAQAFQGTPTLPNPNIAIDGSASRNITSPTTETIMVGSSKATINWTPNDNDSSGPIDFLPAGNVATFTNDPNTTPDFTVLNRIVPADASRPILLNGTVISQLQDLSSNTTAGGKVWFYSPGGIVVGATAVFDVGGLLLTVNDPTTWNPTANGFTGNFAASANSTANVTIDPGAKITATPENSYVAIVAPRVVQNGDVNVNGSAAYVAGEDVTLTMNQGLFDIAVNVGTSDPFNPDSGNGVVHNGNTGGPSSTGAAGDNHRIYMVAVPKNQAMTMLLGGNIGFQPAASASVVNGTIVLAAGSSVAETSGTLTVTSPGTIDADMKFLPGTYSSNVRAFARGDISAVADSGDISFLHDVSLTSLLAGSTGMVSVGASGGHKVSVGGNLLM